MNKLWVCDVEIYSFIFVTRTHHHGGTSGVWLGSCGAGRNGSLNLHDNIVPTIGKGNRSQGVEDSKQPLVKCVSIKVVLGAGLLASMSRNANGNGGLANGHHGRKQGDGTELVEVGSLHAQVKMA